MTQFSKKKIETFKLMTSRLQALPRHAALFLLQHSIGIPRLVYLLRSSLLFQSQSLLQEYDTIMVDTGEKITNCKLDDAARLQMTLPIKHGGLAIRQTTTLAVIGYIASTYATLDIVSRILPPYISSSTDFMLMEAVQSWDNIMT